MNTPSLSLSALDAINDRLHKANGIAGMIRVSEGSASEYALTNAAWAIEGLLDEVEKIINDQEPLRGNAA